MNTYVPSFDIGGNDRPQSTPGPLGCPAAMRSTAALVAVALAALVGVLVTDKTTDAAGGSDASHATALPASEPEAAEPGAYTAP